MAEGQVSMSLAKKFAYIMTQVQYIQKRGHNKFHGYHYATEADVNEKIREVMAEKNVVMLPCMKAHTMRETKTAKGDIEYIVCVDMDFTFIDADSGETYTVPMSGEGQDRGDKAIYKAISGCQKYVLMKTFMIPTGDDPEEETPSGATPTTNKPKPSESTPSSQELNALATEMKKAGLLKSDQMHKYMDTTVGHHDTRKLTKSDVEKLRNNLTAYVQELVLGA